MWSGKNKVWSHYRMDILAAETQEGEFLANYLRFAGMQKLHVPALEVIDLQRYKVISQKIKVQISLKDRANTPFVFVIGKN